jgi:acetate kinase
VKRILSLDRGSSSLKFAVHEVESANERLTIVGGVEPLGAANATLSLRDERAAVPHEARRALGSSSPIDA